MANFAELNNDNIVIRVIVVGDEHESDGENWCNALLGGRWKQTSRTARIRKNYAGPGYRYEEELDAFIPPRPYPSWNLNKETCNWESPNPQPTDGYFYRWSESIHKWMPVNKKLFAVYGSDSDGSLIEPTVKKYGLRDGELVTIIDKPDYLLRLEKANSIIFVHAQIPDWKPSIKKAYLEDIDELHREIGTYVYAYHPLCNLELGDTKPQLIKFAELFGFYEFENAILGDGYEHFILRREVTIG